MLGDLDRPEFGVEMLSEEVRRFLRLQNGGERKVQLLLVIRWKETG